MARLLLVFVLAFHFLVIPPIESYSKSPVVVNVIDGQVFDERRYPVYNAFVELYNSVNASVGRTRTSTQGRFMFSGMGSGRYTIKVLPFGTDLLPESQDIEVVNQAQRSDLVVVEFRLRIDRRIRNVGSNETLEAIFVQEIPPKARELYDSGVKKLEGNAKEGLKDLESAVQIFPAYFDAQSRLGIEYVSLKEFRKGYPFLLNAIEVNQRCASCYYSLAYSFYQLKEIPAAVRAATAAVILKPSSADVNLLLGTILRINSDFKNAEKALLKAKSLVKTPNPEIHWQLSLLYNRQGENTKAVAELEIFLRLMPNTSDREKIEELISKLRLAK